VFIYPNAEFLIKPNVSSLKFLAFQNIGQLVLLYTP